MQAVILASGQGSRLKHLTENLPKCLVSVGGVPILGRILGSLLANGVNNALITTGPFEEKIKNFVKENYPSLQVTYINSDKYNQTNAIYSLWLAKDFIEDQDIILMHSDLIFDPALMAKIVDSEVSCALVQKSGPVPEKDFKALIDAGLIKKIGVEVDDPIARFLVPIYKFMAADWQKFITRVDKLVKAGSINLYPEEAFNQIADQVKLYPSYYGDELAMEIDDLEDFAKAEKLL
jgi:choline kinase